MQSELDSSSTGGSEFQQTTVILKSDAERKLGLLRGLIRNGDGLREEDDG